MKQKINRGIENKMYIAIIVIVSVCVVTFFTSKMWMYDDNEISQTPFHSDIHGLDEMTIILNKWEYNPNKELMEISLEAKHTGTDQVKPTLSFAAKERESLTQYPVKIVYNDDTNIVLQLKNVPETYRVIGLFVREERDKTILENEMKINGLEPSGTLEQENSEVIYEFPEPKEIVIVGDYRKIKVNNKLETKHRINYQEENIKREIKQIENKIDEIKNAQIPHQEELIVSIEKEIKSLEEEMKYNTKEEQQEATAQINDKKEAIKNVKKEQEELQEETESLNEKHEKLLEKLQDVRLGNRRDTSKDGNKEVQEDEQKQQAEKNKGKSQHKNGSSKQ